MYENPGDPNNLLTFLELPLFVKRLEELGLSLDVDLLDLQREIAQDPAAAPVVQGTKSIRKIRFAPASWNTGKRGATRILFVYFETFGVVLLIYIYAKNEKDNIAASVKKYLNELVDEIAVLLAGQFAELRTRQEELRQQDKRRD